jgi:zinc protease
MTEVRSRSHVEPLANRVRESQAGPVRLLVLPTPVANVVSLRGIFLTEPDFAAGEELLQDLTVNLLDRGTRRRDRFEIATMLDDRGAQLGFDSEGRYASFAGRCLVEHMPEVVEALAEQLREPLLDEGEFEKTRSRIAASVQREMENTASQASDALCRMLYERAHPNFASEPAEDLARLAALRVDDVHRYHREHFGARGMLIVAAGDVDEGKVAAALEKAFGNWEDHGAEAAFAAEARRAAPGRSTVPIPDKQNIDVRLGHGVAVTRQSDDYLPLYVGLYILGGNFAARLMQRIRDEQGLTYGIGAGLAGITTYNEGHWFVGVTLSTENLDRGIEAVQHEIELFVREGVTQEELDEKKTTITGSYKVGLASTAGLARTVLNNARRGFEVGYLDRFPSLVEALTVDEVNAAIRTHLHPENLHLVAAGTVDNSL